MAMVKPMFPRPMMPRECPRGLWESAAAWVWQSAKVSGERAAVVHLFSFVSFVCHM